MEVVRQVMEELQLDIPIAGLAKDRKHRTSEVLFGFPPQTIGIKQHSPLFRLLEQIQDEVHRFAITFHRDKRSKRQVASAPQYQRNWRENQNRPAERVQERKTYQRSHHRRSVRHNR